MAVNMRWVWGNALLWTVLDLIGLAMGWQDLRGAGSGIIHAWFFAAALRWVAAPAENP